MNKKLKEEVSEIEKALKPIVKDESTYLDLMDSARFEHLQRVARVFSQSQLVPKHFQKNEADCIIACQMAMRLNVDPMMMMQGMYVVHGRPAFEGKLVIALVNSRGPFKGPIQFRYEGEGKTRQCTAYATHKLTGELCAQTVDWATVEAEGWNKPKGNEKSKWMTLTDLMFAYRSATFLARLHCPEVLMGLKTADELEDIGHVIDVTPEAPLAMPRSVKEAESEGEPVEERDRSQAETEDTDPKKVAPGRGNSPGKGNPSKIQEAAGESSDLFSDEPDEEEQAEILKEERGQYGPP